MITKELKNVNSEYNEIVKVKLAEVYKDITGLDLAEFRDIVIADIDSKEEDINEFNKNLTEGQRAKVLDPGFRSEQYILEKTEEAFQIALNAFKKETGVEIVFEETYDDKGNNVLEFGVTKLINKYVIPVSLETKLEVGEIKKFNLES